MDYVKGGVRSKSRSVRQRHDDEHELDVPAGRALFFFIPSATKKALSGVVNGFWSRGPVKGGAG